MKKIFVCWLSGGVSSFVCSDLFYLNRESYGFRDGLDEMRYIYIDVYDQLPDTLDFIRSCESYQHGHRTEILRSNAYSVHNAVMQMGIMKNPLSNYYPCTNILKVRVRKQWESEFFQKNPKVELHYIWGFDFNLHEKDRAERMERSNPQAKHHFPLIEKKFRKKDIHGYFYMKFPDIERPVTYSKLGLKNNNCIFCMKSSLTSCAIFKDLMYHPDKFGYSDTDELVLKVKEIYNKRVMMEERFQRAMLRASDGSPVFLKDLDENYRGFNSEIVPECNFMCYFEMGV